MRRLIGFCLNIRFIVIILAAAILVVGVFQLRQMPVDVLPEFSPPYVEIQTEAQGLSAEEVEQLVTLGLEQDLLNGVPWLDSIRSESLPGLSSITLIFEPGTNLIRARQMVGERLAQAFALPHVSKPPSMIQPLSSTSRVMIVGLSSKELSLIQMSVLARWTIAPRLMGVPGVANVAIWGQRDRQLQVLVSPKKLEDKKVSLLQVMETTGNALWVSSLSFVEASTPGTGGFIDTNYQRLGIRHLLPIVSADGLAQVPIENTGVVLGDVASVVEDHQPLIGNGLTDAGPGLLLVIEKFPGSNTLEVTRGIEDALNELAPGLSGLKMDSSLYRPANFLETSIKDLSLAFLIGFLLVILALFAIFFSWRSAMISLISIPVSLLTATLVLSLTGATFNTIAMTGFMIAIGVVVEDSIIDVENIIRRLRQTREAGIQKSAASVIIEASLEMRMPVIYALLILLLAVTPIFFIEGASGAFFQPLSLSYGLAILASTLVAIILTPALGMVLLANADLEKAGAPIAGRIQKSYGTFLSRNLQRWPLALVLAGIFTVIGLAVLPSFDFDFLPQFKERNLLIHLSSVPGTSETEMTRISERISQELRAIPGVTNVGAHIGRAIFGDQMVNVNSAEMWVDLDDKAPYENSVANIKRVVNGYPGILNRVETYLNETGNTLSNEGDDQLTIRVYGDGDAELQSAAGLVKNAVTGINGVTDAQIKLPSQQPTLDIEVDLAAAQKFGIKPGDVRRSAATMFSGLQVGNLFEEQKVFDVVVWSPPETRQSITNISNLLIDTPDGGHVRLGDVAKVKVGATRSIIQHEAVKRYLDVFVNTNGRNLADVSREIKASLSQLKFPLEYHAELLGTYTDQQAALLRILVIAAAAALGIFLLLQAAFKSWSLATIAVLTLPMALSGGIIAALLDGNVISLGTLGGLLVLLGVAIRSGITLTAHLRHLEDHEGEHFGPDLVERGLWERVVPTLLTVAAIILAFIPALFLGDIPGLEFMRPMAVVITGGLVTTTLLDLYVLPILFLRFAAKREPDLGLQFTPPVDLPVPSAD